MAGKNAARGGEDRNAHAAEDAGNFPRTNVAAQAGSAHTLQTGDGARFVDEFGLDGDLLVSINGFKRGVFDVTFFFKDLGDLALELGVGK